MTEYILKNQTIDSLKVKVAALTTFFGVTPKVEILGKFQQTRGGHRAVEFKEYQPIELSQLHLTRVLLTIDGKELKLAPEGGQIAFVRLSVETADIPFLG